MRGAGRACIGVWEFGVCPEGVPEGDLTSHGRARRDAEKISLTEEEIKIRFHTRSWSLTHIGEDPRRARPQALRSCNGRCEAGGRTHTTHPGPAAPPTATRSWIVQPVRDRATGARSMPDTNMAVLIRCAMRLPVPHTGANKKKRRLCGDETPRGRMGSQRSNEPGGVSRTETERRAHQPSPHARDRVREPESILYCDCGGQADRQSVGRRMADERAVAEISRV